MLAFQKQIFSFCAQRKWLGWTTIFILRTEWVTRTALFYIDVLCFFFFLKVAGVTVSAYLLIYSFLFFKLLLGFGLDFEFGLGLTLGLQFGLGLGLGLG